MNKSELRKMVREEILKERKFTTTHSGLPVIVINHRGQKFKGKISETGVHSSGRSEITIVFDDENV